MFGTQGVVEGGSYIEPGVQRVILKEIVADTSPNGKDYIKLSFYKVGSQPDTARDFRFFMSTEGAIKASSKKILHLGTKMVTREALDGAGASDLATYAANLNALLAGKEVRLVFDGEEYYKNGAVKVAAKLNRLGDFAEACVEGSSSPVVEDENTRLVFDENKHIQRAEPIDLDISMDMPSESLEY